MVIRSLRDATWPDGFGEEMLPEELQFMAEHLYRVLNVEKPKSDLPFKTAVLDFFGTAKSYKTSVTGKFEQFFRRMRYKIFCPPETAEIAEIRAKNAVDMMHFQAQHVMGVTQYVLNYAYSPYHAFIMSRGMIDMLQWYERWVLEGKCPQEHREHVRNSLYDFIRRDDLVDVFVYFFCSPEEAIRREYGGSVVQERGSNMNEEELVASLDRYAAVLAHLEENIPDIRVLRIDTTHMTVQDAAQETLRMVLPALCGRFGISHEQILPFLPKAVRRIAHRITSFEEQLKLKGHPSDQMLAWNGWYSIGNTEHHDAYLDVPHAGTGAPTREIERIRTARWPDSVSRKYAYKSLPGDQLLSHRRTYQAVISEELAKKMLSERQIIAEVKNSRRYFGRTEEVAKRDDYRYTLCLDTIEGLGEFTELRVRGTPAETHTDELLRFASQLGFLPDAMVNKSYLELVLAK